MTTSDDNLKYQFSIKARNIKKYIKRKCPCIFFFDNSNSVESYYLVTKVTDVSKKYPSVFCYKTG